MAILTPIVFLWTGLAPLIHVTTEAVIFYLVPMALAIVGGIWVCAPQQYFPLAAQVLGTFQSFKIMPTVLMTFAKPFGHIFKVTPKGSQAVGPAYQRDIFWTSAILMALTITGLMINTVPEWRIVGQLALLPMVACWGAINVVVLFLVCMLSLQAPVRRGEERFEIHERISVFSASGALFQGEIGNISLSGVALRADEDRAVAASLGERVRLYISEVGFVAGDVVRHDGRLLGIHFDLPASVERDLLIRKLFTSGLDASVVTTSAWAATGAMLGSIWTARSPRPSVSAAPPSVAADKLPAESLVVAPKPVRTNLKDLVEQRRAAA